MKKPRFRAEKINLLKEEKCELKFVSYIKILISVYHDPR
jgi:hypothetical protein